MGNIVAIASQVQPQLAEIQQVAPNNSTAKLILMGGMLVVFVAIFVMVSKKMKKK